jgi:hypothetical protein
MRLLIVIAFLASACFAGDGAIVFKKITKEGQSYFKPDTQRIAKDKMVIRSVIIDTVTIKIDTSYEHSTTPKGNVIYGDTVPYRFTPYGSIRNTILN